jgi:hypothetical protein
MGSPNPRHDLTYVSVGSERNSRKLIGDLEYILDF